MPKLVIELNTENAKSYCGRLCDWFTTFPVCRSCQKGGQGSIRFVNHQGEVSERQSPTTPVPVAFGTSYPGGFPASTQLPGYPTQTSVDGGYNNRSFLETDDEIIFELATPATINAAALAAAAAAASNSSNNQHPIPDVVPKTEQQQQVFSIRESKVVAIQRSDVQFTKSLGRGWFGWIVEGQLKRTDPDTGVVNYEHVVAQILKEEANFEEQARFVDGSKGARLAAANDNVLRLVGSCAECSPHLQLFEVCSFGDLKTYLRQRIDQVHLLQEEGLVLRFCKQITSGVAALHSVGVVPTDLALRCCQLTPDLNVKVGDYGLAPVRFLEDYVPVNGESQPVRWMPPEVLAVMDRTNMQDSYSEDSDSSSESSFVHAEEFPWTRKNGVWSLAVTLWEVTSFAERPFDSVSDNQFVTAALGQPVTLMAQLGKMRGVEAEAIQSVIDLCFKLDPNARPDCERLDRYLTDFYDCKMEERKQAEAAATEEALEAPLKTNFANFDDQDDIVDNTIS